MRVALNSCYILHSRSYRETSLIIDVFSRNYGKVVVVAKGVKRKNSGLGSLLRLHQRLGISWVGKGEMGTLTAAETDGELFNIAGRWLISAFYLDELLMRLLHNHEDHPELFDAYDGALGKLDRRESESSVIRAFEVQLLKSLGYGLVLDHEADTGVRIDPDKEYYYVINHGPVIKPLPDADCIRISGKALKALNSDKFQDETLMRESKKLTQTLLKIYLGPKPLGSIIR
jgi:DNA repair protein RecO (recombination protein O)